ncbi:MAG: T9SS type A sorting domain-containing protein, partial [Bacteroidales bacterium]|nr:T9SS type A sorting domain-containing protein [Bacteroidales bacterium]
ETIGNNSEVYAIGHTIYVNNAEGAEAIVYDINGQKIATAKEQDNYEFSIRIDGIYLVKVGGASFKVMVK